MKNLNEKTYNEVLTETNDYFQAQGLSIIGEGYKEIATNTALFESYVDQLTEGASADDAANMAQIMANTNAGILRESSMTGIQPVASLSMPVIRKLWPKFALKDAIKTEVAKTPRFVVTYSAPYLFKGDPLNGGQRIDLPRGLNKDDAYEVSEGLKKEYTRGHVLELAAGAADVIDFRYVSGKTGVGETDEHVVIANTPSTAKTQPLDELFLEAYVVTELATGKPLEAGKRYVAWDGDFLKNGVRDGLQIVGENDLPRGVKDFAELKTKGYKVAELKEVIKIGKRLGVYGNGVYAFNGGQLIVQFDGKACKATFAAIGAAGDRVILTTHAGISSEYNEESWSVAFDIKRQDVDIPTGQHLNAPLPIEGLNDLMALYQIDGTKETVELMTNVFAMKLDKEILNFLIESHVNQPRNEAFTTTDGYKTAEEYTMVFDCKPAAGFAGSPKAWREELKPLIDHLAQKIKNNTYLQAGVFTLVANPLDVQLLANVDWQFRGGQGGNIDGVDVDYSVGTYVGANAYKVISSVNVPASQMFVVFTPSADTQMTYKYYPYTFSTEMGYVDPNRSRTPSIMMTKRHQFHEFMPAIGMILIENNDGKGYFAKSVHTATDTVANWGN